mmetsp:Transcript_21594/g.40330  ORF Transcript_21594/g.40330 Transcript_21594/m.40330 type:complete len:292 (-) Transcript_21594:22-897(-)
MLKARIGIMVTFLDMMQSFRLIGLLFIITFRVGLLASIHVILSEFLLVQIRANGNLFPLSRRQKLLVSLQFLFTWGFQQPIKVSFSFFTCQLPLAPGISTTRVAHLMQKIFFILTHGLRVQRLSWLTLKLFVIVVVAVVSVAVVTVRLSCQPRVVPVRLSRLSIIVIRGASPQIHGLLYIKSQVFRPALSLAPFHCRVPPSHQHLLGASRRLPPRLPRHLIIKIHTPALLIHRAPPVLQAVGLARALAAIAHGQRPSRQPAIPPPPRLPRGSPSAAAAAAACTATHLTLHK